MLVEALAADLQAFCDRGLSPEQRARLTHCLLDWVGVAVAGTDEPVSRRAADHVRAQCPGTAAPLLAGGQASLAGCVLANAVSGHALDYDDTHLGYWGHPSSTVAPTVLALAAEGATPASTLLSALAVGIEASFRVGLMAGERHRDAGWHVTATSGIFGAAAAACLMTGLARDRWRHAFALCAVQASGLAAAFGTDAKALQVGRAAQLGLEACQLAALGLDGPLDVLERPGGFLDTRAFSSRTLAAPDEAATRGILFKTTPACFGTQAAVVAAQTLRRRRGGALLPLTSVRVEIPQDFLAICDIRAPRTPTEARFSVGLVVALALTGREMASADAIDDSAVACPLASGVLQRTTVCGNPALAPASAVVSLDVGDAEPLASETVDLAAPGSWAAERSRLEAKFQGLVNPVLGQSAGRELREALLAVETSSDLSAVARLLRAIGTQRPALRRATAASS